MEIFCNFGAISVNTGVYLGQNDSRLGTLRYIRTFLQIYNGLGSSSVDSWGQV